MAPSDNSSQRDRQDVDAFSPGSLSDELGSTRYPTEFPAEECFRAIYESANVGIATSDVEGRILAANPTYERLVGYTENELRGMSWLDITHPDDRAQQQAFWDGIKERGEPSVHFEKRYVRKDGSIVWASLNLAIVRQAHDRPRLGVAIVEDVTERKRTEAALTQREEQYRTVVEASIDGIIVQSLAGVVTFANDRAARLLGYEGPAALVGLRTLDLFAPQDREHAIEENRELIRKGRYSGGEFVLQRKDGLQFPAEIAGSAMLDDNGDPVALTGVFRDITERKQREEQLKFQARLLRAVGQAVIVTSLDGVIQYWNRAAEELYGWKADEVLGRPVAEFLFSATSIVQARRAMRHVRAGETWSGEFEVQRRDGSTIPVLVADAPLLDRGGKLTGIIGVSIDISERKHYEEQLRYQALHDPLTDLPNRTLLGDRIDQAIRRADRQNRPFALLLLDLNHFKAVNDTFGHPYGDRLLQQVGARLQRLIRRSDTVSRLGGDEFALLLEGTTAADATRVVSTLARTLDDPYQLDNQSLYVTGSFGIAAYREHGDDGQRLLQHADVAMYLAKERGELFAVYDPAQDPHSTETLDLIVDLRRAIGGDDLALHYQPKIDPRTSHILGAEALARWYHPRRGTIPPGRFIELAENSGLIKGLTIWVVNAALAQCALWSRQGMPLNVAVNLSAKSLHDPGLPGLIARSLDDWDVDPALLTLEITETSLMLNPTAALDAVTRLHDRGIRVAVDDFGIGYSSLRYLNRLPVDEIKIDRSFVMDMESKPDDAAIVSAVVELGHKLGLHVVAEGVENQATFDLLLSAGCDSIQGYFVSRPLPAGELARWARERAA